MYYPVKHIRSTMRGAPVIAGAAGGLNSALTALLITGWGEVTVSSVTVASGVATVVVSSGNSFELDSIILMDGATSLTELNTEGRVLSSSATGFTFATSAADGVATGTITAKYAPQGKWSKTFSATNKSMFKSTDLAGNGHSYLIDDTPAAWARIRGYEVATSITDGTGPFPTDAMHSGGGYIHKAAGATADATGYIIAADSRYVLTHLHYYNQTNPAYRGGMTRGFGDLIPLAPGGDVWTSCVSCAGGTDYSQGDVSWSLASSASGGHYFPKALSGLGAAVAMDAQAYHGVASYRSGNDPFLGGAPSPVDGKIKTTRIFFRDRGTRPSPRAEQPATYFVPQFGLETLLNTGDTLTGAGSLAGRKLMFLGLKAGSNDTVLGGALLDLHGPWR